jgi:hypothetical protein
VLIDDRLKSHQDEDTGKDLANDRIEVLDHRLATSGSSDVIRVFAEEAMSKDVSGFQHLSQHRFCVSIDADVIAESRKKVAQWPPEVFTNRVAELISFSQLGPESTHGQDKEQEPEHYDRSRLRVSPRS